MARRRSSPMNQRPSSTSNASRVNGAGVAVGTGVSVGNGAMPSDACTVGIWAINGALSTLGGLLGSQELTTETIIAGLKERGIPTMVYYPKPLHQQTAYRRFPVAGNGLPVSERLASEVLSLPMHPYLDTETQDHIVEALLEVMALEGVTA